MRIVTLGQHRPRALGQPQPTDTSKFVFTMLVGTLIVGGAGVLIWAAVQR